MPIKPVRSLILRYAHVLDGGDRTTATTKIEILDEFDGNVLFAIKKSEDGEYAIEVRAVDTFIIGKHAVGGALTLLPETANKVVIELRRTKV